jgi:hypothetical protein
MAATLRGRPYDAPSRTNPSLDKATRSLGSGLKGLYSKRGLAWGRFGQRFRTVPLTKGARLSRVLL